MLIYFSGSIAGGRQDIDLYARIVAELRQRGFDVLDGEVAGGVPAGPPPATDRDIYLRDTGWLDQVAAAGGAVVAEVSRPSLGVGYEIAYARHRHDMPVVCLYRPAWTARCSSMILGAPGVEVIPYSTEELSAALDQVKAILQA